MSALRAGGASAHPVISTITVKTNASIRETLPNFIVATQYHDFSPLYTPITLPAGTSSLRTSGGGSRVVGRKPLITIFVILNGARYNYY